MIRVVVVGNLKEKYLILANEEYIKRLNKYDKIEVIEIKEYASDNYKVTLKNEAEEIKKYLKGYVIRLDISGQIIDSIELANKITDIKMKYSPIITFIIGSSHGLDESITSDYSLSFSKMTFPHQLMRIMLLEQIYRAFTILNNQKYHK